MKEFKIDNKGTTRLFSNKILESLTRTNFLVPVIAYYAIAILFSALAYFDDEINFLSALWLFPSGWLTFTLVEYLIHRFLFHFNAKTEKELDVQYNIHGVHHEFPRDKDRLAMPPVISILVSGGFYLFFRMLMGDDSMLFFSGFVAGYSSYLLIHYAVHVKKPPQNFLKYFWRHHSLHHYASVHSAFSVSLPLWDYVFGTLPDERERMKHSQKLPDRI
jgi:sterol desaturase/sphingolipid hydroxylase (fatty acid hydroxylase superfamily)